MGSLNGVSKDSLAIPFFVTCAGFIIMTLLYRQVLILSINEDEAASLGVNVTVLRFIILMIATLIVSSIICVTGLISLLDLFHLTLPDYSQDAMTDSHTYQADWLVPSS